MLTKQRLRGFGMNVDEICFLYDQGKDEIVHLFFMCPYSQRCVDVVQNWLGFQVCADWSSIHRDRSLTMFCRQIRFAVICALIYHIWRGRNLARLSGYVPHPKSVVQSIMWEMRSRIRKQGRNLSLCNLEWIKSKCLW
ncbi:hypothetical protein RND81_04G054300 [Saponaria officinalis]|uniref:Reverse transcriptase zinc-binding domain-containing protein n=1 Tax=Saponaria officinalis TaxID=3572 RepID=A0AAW1LGP2_SAPOF